MSAITRGHSRNCGLGRLVTHPSPSFPVGTGKTLYCGLRCGSKLVHAPRTCPDIDLQTPVGYSEQQARIRFDDFLRNRVGSLSIFLFFIGLGDRFLF